uniref:Uncharacterized protein n=1 Tax=Siphoviridae sp. ct5FX1 TaxID=2825335 RepID=A0A8S5UPW9_9CAUD|nr:MAG TPA: hypothetical protein [Siphoviridae sp. ct5FX1]
MLSTLFCNSVMFFIDFSIIFVYHVIRKVVMTWIN